MTPLIFSIEFELLSIFMRDSPIFFPTNSFKTHLLTFYGLIQLLSEPINIFQGNHLHNNPQVKNEVINAPMRLCYHRAVHYNSIVDPHKPTIGVGLGLPNYSPGSADKNQVGQAMKQSEQDAVEKTMLEDKIRATGTKREKLLMLSPSINFKENIVEMLPRC